MSWEVSQKLNMFNLFKVIADSRRHRQLPICVPYKFPRCRRSTQAVANNHWLSYGYMETRLHFTSPGFKCVRLYGNQALDLENGISELMF